jgi:hypothetical protein
MLDMAKHLRAQGMEAGERELHLGLDARRLGDPTPLCGFRQVRQQGGLSDSSLTSKHQHTTLACAHSRNESIQLVAFADAIEHARHLEVSVHHGRPGITRQGDPPGNRAVKAE